MLKKALSIICLAIVAGCVAPTKMPAVERIEFPIEEYSALPASGTGVVEGQAFLKTRGGDVKTAAGSVVLLNPVTSYSNQWYEINYILQKPLTEADPRLQKYETTKTADAEGRFKFTNVPPGEYYVVSKVTWEAPTGYQGAMETQGGIVAKRITVKNSETTEIVVTR